MKEKEEKRSHVVEVVVVDAMIVVRRSISELQ